jgi:hypothetical protein
LIALQRNWLARIELEFFPKSFFAFTARICPAPVASSRHSREAVGLKFVRYAKATVYFGAAPALSRERRGWAYDVWVISFEKTD